MNLKTARRNQEILVARASGLTVKQLADSYGLSLKTVRQILSMERHKLAVSRGAFYRNLRETLDAGLIG
jgi:DNA-binding NarL/FixJ family response regulator